MQPRVILALLTLMLQGAIALAQSSVDTDFTVSNIRVEGLQRVSEGTVYNYLPVNIGDRLNTRRVREAIRALYATGFFRDVQLRREGDTLVVAVLERPSIESFDITGNKDIKTEDLQKMLRQAGLTTGKTFDRSVLDEVTQYLTDMYFSRGKYGVRVNTNVEEESGNRVKVKVDIKEGKRAKIRQINVVGNERFKDKTVIEDFELSTPRWNSWYKQNDRYSRESLQGDLEKLRSFYMDRGFANFQIESQQVAISPDKDDIFITINIHEGEVFKLSEVKLAGTFVVPEAELKRYLLVKPGETFNRKQITSTQELLQNRLGQDGYAFAKVDPVPTPDNEKDTISLTFFVEPGNRVYVRNITFGGDHRINDEVLRREMRQLEGGWMSNASLERSKQRIQRLPYVKKVEYETRPVAGSPDLIDVEFNVEEGPSAQLSGGIGYSESRSLILNGNYTDANFMGTGQRIALELESGYFFKNYSFSHTDPAVTMDGVARTLSIGYRNYQQYTTSSSDLDSETLSAGLTYGIPVSERQTLQAGLTFQASQLLTSTGSANQAIEWVKNNGDSFERDGGNFLGTPITFFGTKFRSAELLAGWNFDSRNRTLFPDRGSRYSLSMSAAIPGSDVEYWIARTELARYMPIWGRLSVLLHLEGAYGKPMGDTTALPPFRQFYAGGPDSVRGYRESRLGPKDQNGNPYGGDLLVVGRTELIFPMPQKWATTARVSAFYDIGNVFYQGKGTTFTNKVGLPADYSFRLSNLASSVGLGVQWLAPLGLFRFSYAVPLRHTNATAFDYGDETEQFQFSIGNAF